MDCPAAGVLIYSGMLIDTHCHLTYPGLFEQPAAVVGRAAEAGVERIITIGTDLEDHPRVVGLTREFPAVFGALGIHPHHAEGVSEDAVAAMGREFHENTRLVAVGECGLDYFNASADRTTQAAIFISQLELAIELHLPVILHVRDAHGDALAIIRRHRPTGLVVHCFTGSCDEARAWLELGAWIGFTGIITYKKAGEVRAACQMVPDDRLLIETDAPYLSPVPMRHVKINEPAFVRHTAEFIAALRGQSLEQLSAVTTSNACRLFGDQIAG